MRNDFWVAVVLAFALSGCVAWDAGYTPNAPAVGRPVAAANRFALTYSIVLSSARPAISGFPDANALREKVGRALMATGLFSGATYAEKPSGDSYHIAFDFKQTDVGGDSMMDAESLSAEILGVFPVMEKIAFDGTAVMTAGGRSVESAVRTEEFRRLIWLPLIPFSIFADSSSAWEDVCDGVVNALVSELSLSVR